jgi:Flp pilus assembly protein TadG
MKNMAKIYIHAYPEPWISKLGRRMAIRDTIGQSLIELALVAPLFILLLIGAAEFGRLAYAGIEVSNAARAGVQYGAQSHTTASDNSGMQLAATNDAANIAGVSATATHSCSCADGSSSTCAATDCSASRIIEFVQVNTTATVDPLLYYPGLPHTFTMRGQAIMRVEQ